MGIFDKLGKFMGIEEDDEEEELDEEALTNTPIVPETKTPEMIPLPKTGETAPAAKPAKPEGKVSSFTGKNYTNQFKMVVIEPSGFDESPRLVDSLKAKRPVIINLENLETDVARKIFYFLSGATYALNGNVQKVANNIFVFAPENVDVSYNVNQKPTGSPQSPWK